jgi:biotin transport system substrate-specific component
VSVSVPVPGVIADSVARSRVFDVALVAAGSLFIGIAAQLSIYLPNNPVPITGQTFAVLLVAAGTGLWRGVASTLLYAVLGLAGVPWFAGASSGYVSASFGYIVGFVAAAALVGWLAQRGWTRTPWRTAAAMVLGNLAIYAIGVPWLKATLGISWSKAIDLGLQPFLVADLLKAALAAGLFTAAWALVDRRRRNA